MVLRCLAYFTYIEGMLGSPWAVKPTACMHLYHLVFLYTRVVEHPHELDDQVK
jgi:hypothetical protein